ncbi:glutamate-5-semialdehyde dehydrogenase [Bifidobacterium sp. 79T10]|nr:glutamate-5-semialdehyde dehydrogenase [Bifidobacterium saguinibicoloris]MBW3080692.1 glutamate-5-semialdehyde dehydrogenase [Bifidobacterium saguinibicoloris]
MYATVGVYDEQEESMVTSVSLRVHNQVCMRALHAASAQRELARTHTDAKNALLNAIADALDARAGEIAAANALDMASSREAGMDEGKLDRLRFDEPRVKAAAEGVRHVATLPDPVGEIVRGYTLPNGLRLNQTRVPIGVIGMIYEARPNVTVDVASLCIKSGNAVILRGGHAAERTNAATLAVIGDVLEERGFRPGLVASVDEFGREGATAMMEARGYIDLLVPRGGRGLIQAVVENSKVPVIETGAGNVHIYVDASADQDKALPILINAKTQRVGVCNAAEKLLVHADVADEFLPKAAAALFAHGVVIHADIRAYEVLGKAFPEQVRTDAQPEGLLCVAMDEDWDTEYLALEIGVKVVDSLDEAIDHINEHSTGHTESIVSEDYTAIEEFTSRIDSAVVMVNASTRFTDGGVFGFGAELGISTQKMHARGPMGLREMTTTKWIGYGMGQVRA